MTLIIQWRATTDYQKNRPEFTAPKIVVSTGSMHGIQLNPCITQGLEVYLHVSGQIQIKVLPSSRLFSLSGL